jgi:hypothetical protein
MNWLANGFKQIYGLFVDDGLLSLAICAWLLLAWFVLPHVIASASARPVVLFAGLAALLMDSVRRASRPAAPDS